MKGLTARNLAWIQRKWLTDLCSVSIENGVKGDTEVIWKPLDPLVTCRLFEGGSINIAGQQISQVYDGVMLASMTTQAIQEGKRYKVVVQVRMGNLEKDTADDSPQFKRTVTVEIQKCDVYRDPGGNDILQVWQVRYAQ